MTGGPENSSPAKRAGVAIAATVALAAAVIFGIGPAGYLVIKALHVIAVMSWMAGMLYLPRLFIYHCDAVVGSVQSETFKVMEQRLVRIIINPAMVISWVLGLWLAWVGNHWMSIWFLAKFAFVLLLSASHGYFSAAVRKFAQDRNTVSPRAWRLWNEVPTVAMIAIVLLVIVKPFA